MFDVMRKIIMNDGAKKQFLNTQDRGQKKKGGKNERVFII